MSRREDTQAALALRTLRGAARNALSKREELRFHVVRDAWALVKRFGSPAIENIELRELPAICDGIIEGYIDDPNRAVLAGLCRALKTKTFFEIGTNRGRTAWTVARNNPDCRIYTLDLPDQGSLSSVSFDLNESDKDFFVDDWDRGEAYVGTPEQDRITTLEGDSATFDFSPYEGRMDAVFIDGAHSYDYVRSDTANALRMLAPDGLIVWDDYPAIPGVYSYLNEIAPTLGRPMYHIYGTRLVIATAGQVVSRLLPGSRARLFAA